MISTSKDISNKLAKPIVDALIEVSHATEQLGLPFFVVGATARDIVFSAMFDVRTTRASLDVDLGLRVDNWEGYARLLNTLTKDGAYVKSQKQMQRLTSKSGVLVDMIPFGKIEKPAGAISWPPHHDIVMKTIGFEEGFQHSTVVTIAYEPVVRIRVCTPASFAIMKLVAWQDKYPERGKDAIDLLFLLRKYIYAGNENRLYAEDRDLHEVEQFDYETASARLLGRDVRKISSGETLEAVLEILEKETRETSQFRLLGDMVGIERSEDGVSKKNLTLLKQFKNGIQEDVKQLTPKNP